MTEANNQGLTSIRAKLDAGKGREYWRSLEELAETDEFNDFLHREFPQQASEWNDPAGRRRFLKLMGASIALAGASACTVQPTEKIIPYVRQPEEMIPGKPLFFATAASISGIASPLLVESHMGRPTKVEGNPEHPVSLGATDLFSQASVLALYDPDRSQTVTHLGDISKGWPAFLAAFRLAIEDQRGLQGAGLRVLTETVTSPTLAAQLTELRDAVSKDEMASVRARRPLQRNRGSANRIRRARDRAMSLRQGRCGSIARCRLSVEPSFKHSIYP